MKTANFLFALCLGVASPSGGGDVIGEGSMAGAYFVKTGPFEVDPDPADRAVRLYMSIRGDGARAMYEAIEGRERSDFCDYEEAWVKRVGNVTCFRTLRTYECVFALNMKNGSLESAVAC